MLSPVACTALNYSPTFSQKQHDFRTKKGTENKICFDFHYKLFSEIFPILTANERDMIKMYVGLHVQQLLFLYDFNET